MWLLSSRNIQDSGLRFLSAGQRIARHIAPTASMPRPRRRDSQSDTVSSLRQSPGSQRAGRQVCGISVSPSEPRLKRGRPRTRSAPIWAFLVDALARFNYSHRRLLACCKVSSGSPCPWAFRKLRPSCMSISGLRGGAASTGSLAIFSANRVNTHPETCYLFAIGVSVQKELHPRAVKRRESEREKRPLLQMTGKYGFKPVFL